MCTHYPGEISMKKIAVRALVVSLLAIQPHSTIAFSFKETMSKFFNKFKWEKTLQETLELKEKISPTTKIIISNIHGDINITTWSRNELLANITRKGNESAYHATKVSARFVGDTFTLLTSAVETEQEKKAKKCTVTYNLVVPKNAQLHSITTNRGKIFINGTHAPIIARSHHGNIILENIAGEARVQTKHGNITIKTQDITAKQTILAVSDSGNILLHVPKSIEGAQIVACTKKGSVVSQLPITSTRTMELNPKTVAQMSREVKGTIGKGGAHIKLETGRGNITLSTLS